MMHLKKLLPGIEVTIILLLTKGFMIDKSMNISESIISILNTYSVSKLIDVFSIVVYLLPLIIWTSTLMFSVNTYYENFNFLVTRLGGAGAFERKVLLKIFKDAAFLIFSTYIILMIFLVAAGHSIEGNYLHIGLSAVLNYSVIVMAGIIFSIFRIYNKFPTAFASAYCIKISLFVIGLFLKYMESGMFLIKNPLVNTIIILKGEYGMMPCSYYIKILTVHLAIIIILAVISNYLLTKRRRLND